MVLILQRLAAHDLRLECYYESPIFPPRFYLLGCDVPEIALYLQLPTSSDEAADAAQIELSAIYGVLRLLQLKPWHQYTQAHPSTLLFFDLRDEFMLLPPQRAFLCHVILLALLRGLHLIGAKSDWVPPALDRVHERVDRVLPKLLDH